MALLEIRDLSVWFGRPPGEVRAVDGVSLKVHHGETVCLVGESGSGKSLTALSAMGLLPEGAGTSGEIRFNGETVCRDQALHHGHRATGRGMAMVFQEPMASLNPSMRVAAIVAEGYRQRKGVGARAAAARVTEVLGQVGIASANEVAAAYPWQLSGGLAQRVALACALVLEPKVLIADEPTTALDVTTQAQILRLLLDLRRSRGLAVLFVTHDLGVASLMGGTMAVMHEGRILERGPALEVTRRPSDPFTRKLMTCAAWRGRAARGPDAAEPVPPAEADGGPDHG